MNPATFSSAARPAAGALRKILNWTILLAIGASLATTLPSKASAQPAAPAKPTAAATTSPAANSKPVSAALMAHSCAACHGTNGQLGDESFMPLAGMPVKQFVTTMGDFRTGKRPATLMGHVAKGFTDADLQAMGEFFAAVPPLAGSVAIPQGAK